LPNSPPAAAQQWIAAVGRASLCRELPDGGFSGRQTHRDGSFAAGVNHGDAMPVCPGLFVGSPHLVPTGSPNAAYKNPIGSRGLGKSRRQAGAAAVMRRDEGIARIGISSHELNHGVSF